MTSPSSRSLSAEHRALIAAVPSKTWKALSGATRAKLSSPGCDLDALRILCGAPAMSLGEMQVLAATQAAQFAQLQAQLVAAQAEADPLRDASGRPSLDARMQMLVPDRSATSKGNIQQFGGFKVQS